MSATLAPASRPAGAATLRCPRCRAALASRQEWCLSCGAAATTRVAPPPNWRLPALLIAALLALACGALVAAFVARTHPGAQNVTTAAPPPAKTLTVTLPARTVTAPARP